MQLSGEADRTFKEAKSLELDKRDKMEVEINFKVETPCMVAGQLTPSAPCNQVTGEKEIDIESTGREKQND
jgi:hypothetical protein